MAHSFESCANCGAPIEVAADGRSAGCPYCGARERRMVDPALLANALRAEFQHLDQFFEALAERLARSFPAETRVRRGGGFLSKKRLEALEVALDAELFELKREQRGVVARRAQVVRGITVKTEELAMDAWVQALCTALSARAEASTQAHAALKRLFEA